MRIVLVGMFRDWKSAEAARLELSETGFAASSMVITPTDAALADDKRLGCISVFFRSLFGADGGTTQVQGPYDDAFGRGRCALTVIAETDAEVDRAEDVLNAAGVIDLAETVDPGEGDPRSRPPGAASRVRRYTPGTASLSEASREPSGR